MIYPDLLYLYKDTAVMYVTTRQSVQSCTKNSGQLAFGVEG